MAWYKVQRRAWKMLHPLGWVIRLSMCMFSLSAVALYWTVQHWQKCLGGTVCCYYGRFINGRWFPFRRVIHYTVVYSHSGHTRSRASESSWPSFQTRSICTVNDSLKSCRTYVWLQSRVHRTQIQASMYTKALIRRLHYNTAYSMGLVWLHLLKKIFVSCSVGSFAPFRSAFTSCSLWSRVSARRCKSLFYLMYKSVE